MAQLVSQNAFAFNSGELSPLLLNRQDQARYSYGVKRMRNFLPTLQGPARKRPGLRFVGEIAASASRSWLIPFIFAQTDAYILELGNSTVRFYTDNGQVLESTTTITDITEAAQAVVTSNAHGYANGDEVVLDAVVGLNNANGNSLVNGRNFRVSDQTANTYKLKDLFGNYLDLSTATAYSSGGTAARVYQIASPWTISNLTDSSNGTCLLSFVQDSDVLYMCVPGFQPQKLTRTSPTSWAFSDFEPEGGPFKTIDPDETITVYAGAATGNTTLTASSSIFTADHVGSLFLLEMKLTDIVTAWEVGKSITAGDVRRSQGHYYESLNTATTGTITPSHTEGARYDGDTGVQWQYRHSGYGWLEITAFNSGTSVNATVISRIPTQAVGAGNPSTRWAFGAWSDEEGWPTHVAFFRERLCFARDTGIWGSIPSDFENFLQRDAGVVADDSAFAIDIRRGTNDAIQWMVDSGDLIVGTEADTPAVGEISTADPLSPINIRAIAGPRYGTRRVPPIVVNDSIFTVQNAGRNVREVRFTFETDGYSSLEKTVFAEHIAKGQIIQMAYANEPASVGWMVCNNGDMIAVSYQREHDLLAWHKHPLGGSALAESIAVIPSPDGTRSQVWVEASLTINSQTKRYVGYLEEDWDYEDGAAEDMFYVDFGLTYDGTPETEFRADHLTGATGQVFADGDYIGDYTATSGIIDISAAKPDGASVVQFGKSYTSILESMPVARPGVFTRITRAFVRVLGALGGVMGQITKDQKGRSEEKTRTIDWRLSSLPLITPTPPFTGIRMVEGGSGPHGREVTWLIEHTAPTAFTVSGVIPEIATTTEKNR